jgi:hypothetical protein
MSHDTSPEHSRLPPYDNTFAVVLGILAISNVLSTIFGWFRSVDVKGWWPVILAFELVISCAYAWAYSFIARKGRSFSRRFSVFYTLALSGCLLVHTALYYLARPDWLAVNNGLATLTLFQRVVFNPYTELAIYGLFLGLATIRALRSRQPAG